MFDLINANTVRRRMRELRKFIDFWYGRHKRKFEVREPDPRLPLPLRLFYRHNGNRPCPRTNDGFFYFGETGHKLFAPEHLKFERNRVMFFTEYQRDWDGYTLKSEDDPPVWLCGTLPMDRSFEKDEKGERQLSQTLSEFLVTHVLLTSIYELENCATMCYGEHHQSLVEKFYRASTVKTLIWDSEALSDPYCPHYAGKIYLYSDYILIYEISRGDLVFASNTSEPRNWFDD